MFLLPVLAYSQASGNAVAVCFRNADAFYLGWSYGYFLTFDGVFSKGVCIEVVAVPNIRGM